MIRWNFKRGKFQKSVSDEVEHVLVLDDHDERNRHEEEEDGGVVLGQVEALAVGRDDKVEDQMEAEHQDHQDGCKAWKRLEDIIAISCWIEVPKNGAIKKVLTKKYQRKKS